GAAPGGRRRHSAGHGDGGRYRYLGAGLSAQRGVVGAVSARSAARAALLRKRADAVARSGGDFPPASSEAFCRYHRAGESARLGRCPRRCDMADEMKDDDLRVSLRTINHVEKKLE